jgi:ankyrin repeat protein
MLYIAASHYKTLLQAIKDNNVTEAQAVLEENLNLNIDLDDRGAFLHLAVLYSRESIVELLLQHNANTNVVNWEGKTPLAIAVKENHLNIAAHLLKHNASPNIIGNNYHKYYKAVRIFMDVVLLGALSMLITNPRADKIDQALLIIAFSIRLFFSESLLWHSAKLEDNRAPLLIAAQNNQFKMVKLLVDHGAILNVRDPKSGKTALHWSVQNENIAMIELLIKAGIEVNLPDANGDTALDIAINIRNNDIMKYLESGYLTLIPNEKYEISEDPYHSPSALAFRGPAFC